MKKSLLLLPAIAFSFLGHSQINFKAQQTNPFGITTNPSGWYACPTFADMDADGDQDMLSGSAVVSGFYYSENIGSIDNPAFAAPVLNPFNLVNGTGETKPCLVDLDNDGDFDMMFGDNNGAFNYFENIGSTTTPSFGPLQTNPFSLVSVGVLNTPAFVDIDADGDLDLFSGVYNSFTGIRYFENIGTANSPNFATVVTNPFSIVYSGTETNVEFADLDKDGDYDLMASKSSFEFSYLENIGTSSSPIFDAEQSGPFGLITGGSYAKPAFVDLDNDNDMDIITGLSSGSFRFYENAPNDPINATLSTDTLVCFGDSTILSATGIGTLKWFDASIGGNFLGSGSTFNTSGLTINSSFYVQDSTFESGISSARTEISVTVNPLPNVSTTTSGLTLTADLSGANYQWLDCSNNYAQIVGETSQNFLVTSNRPYAVIIDNGSCSDTSACIAIADVGFSQTDSYNLEVYPNPTNNQLTILSKMAIQEISIIDVNGRVVLWQVANASNNLILDLISLESGIYYLKTLDVNGHSGMTKIIKK